ncbi:MAG: tetratricopeptide repeat protein [Phycisphaerae bacterium]
MNQPFRDPAPVRTPAMLRPWCLRTLALVVLLAFGSVGAVRTMERARMFGAIGLAGAAEIGVWLGVGLAAAGLLLSVGAIVRLLADVRAGLERIERFQYETHPTSTGDPDEGTATSYGSTGEPDGAAAGEWQELLMVLRDIRDNGLLSEEERHEKKQRVGEDEIRNTRAAVSSLIEGDDFVQARAMAERLQQKYPDNAAAALVGEVETAREKRESSDIRQCEKQVDELTSISAWDRARQLAEDLRQRHPDAVEPLQLIDRIEREFQVFQQGQRQRMYAEIQRYTSRRRWVEALSAARTFIERFPRCQESEMLQVEIPTLRDNAEIAMRQDMEAEIMDLATHGRYMEAAALARKVIEQFPESPQAEVLRGQLERLDQLANDPDAPPARVRID